MLPGVRNIHFCEKRRMIIKQKMENVKLQDYKVKIHSGHMNITAFIDDDVIYLRWKEINEFFKLNDILPSKRFVRIEPLSNDIFITETGLYTSLHHSPLSLKGCFCDNILSTILDEIECCEQR
ncbi:hypothetical protein DOLIC_00026 [Dolichomitus sp. PSUC_FEM 10030005]|nr:hypothetical protein [Dolichomitus sp. PSUC_FEM 10030005]